MTVRLPDGQMISGVPKGMTQVELLGHLQLAQHPSAEALMKNMASNQALEDIGPYNRFRAGGGLAFRNIGRTALGMRDDYEENKAYDKPLMRTPAGAAGNIGTNIALFAPAAAIPGANTATGAGIIGGTMALMSHPSDTMGEKVKDLATGVALGFLPQYGATTGAQKIGEWAARREADAALRASQNSVRDNTLRQGQQAGYVVPPSAVAPSFVTNRLESIGGKAATGQEAALRNQAVTDKLAREAAGLTPEQAISLQNLRAARGTAASPYRELAALSPAAANDLQALQQARFDAKTYWKHYNRSAEPASLKTAQTADVEVKRLADALEKHAADAGRQDLIPALTEARRRIAQNRQVQEAVNRGTGSVDASVIGRALDQGAPLSGPLKTIGEFQQAFKPYMREASAIPTPGVSKSEALASALLATGGHAATGSPAGVIAGGLPLLSGPARSAVLSNRVQSKLAPDYGSTAVTRNLQALQDPDAQAKAAMLARILSIPAIPATVNQ